MPWAQAGDNSCENTFLVIDPKGRHEGYRHLHADTEMQAQFLPLSGRCREMIRLVRELRDSHESEGEGETKRGGVNKNLHYQRTIIPHRDVWNPLQT